MFRSMADPGFVRSQREGVDLGDVAALNAYIRTLADPERGVPPLIAPMHGGASASILAVYRDPGPKAAGERGSGFLCWENNDASAERMAGLATCAGLLATDLVPWNAYPWYINRRPSRAELKRAVPVLWGLLERLPSCRVLILFGGDAQRFGRLVDRDRPGWSERRGIVILRTFHTSRQALHHRDPQVRAYRNRHIFETLVAAGRLIGRQGLPECTCPASSTVVSGLAKG